MSPQPGTAGTGDDPLDQLVTQELTVNGQTVTRLVGLAFDSADQTDGVLRFDGTGSTNGITDGSAEVLVNGTVYDIAGAEWVDLSGTRHTVDSWEKVINSQFDVTITGTNGPVAPGNTLDVTADVTNSGTDQDTQTVTLDINNGVGQVDSTSVTLTGGGSTTTTVSWAVPSGQTAQDYTATVSSADDSASQTVTVSSGPSLVAQQDLVAWYPMENGDARDAANTTDFGDATAYDGTVNGATHEPSGGVTDVSAGPSSGAFSFNDGSSSDRIDIGNIPSIEGVSQLTVCAWLNETEGGSDKEAVGDFGPDGSFGNTLAMSANSRGPFVYRVRKNGTRLNTSTTISRDGSYAHFAFVFDNGSIQGYKNGSPTGSSSGGPSTTPSVQLNLGGRFSSDNDYTGDIDDVRFYASALTDSEINQIYTNTQP